MSCPATNPADRFYQGPGGHEYHDKKRALHPEVLDWVLRLRAEKMQPHVQPADVVFEFGVGSGWNLGKLICKQRTGYDRAEFLADKVRALGIEFVEQIESVPAGSSDVVICHHALEHVTAPDESLRQMRKILKPGGKLILHVPWERERRYQSFDPAEPNHHLYSWNAQSLGNLLTVLEFDLKSIRARKYGYDRFAANTAHRLKAGERGFRLLRRLLLILKPLWEIEAVVTR